MYLSWQILRSYCFVAEVTFKQNKKRLLLLIPENTGDGAFSMHKNKIPTEYREKGVIKYFKCIYFLIDCQSKAFLLMNITISDISKLAVKTPERSFYC